MAEWKEGKSKEEVEAAEKTWQAAYNQGLIQDWESNDPGTYAQNKDEVIDLLADLVKIKRRRVSSKFIH